MADKLPYFGPLNFDTNDRSLFQYFTLESEETMCPLCDYTILLPAQEKDLLTHLFMNHRLVIADVNKIADLRVYITFWRSKFTVDNLGYYCTTVLMDQKPDGVKSKDEKYFLLSDVLPEDEEIRAVIQKQKLDKLLTQHKFERVDSTFERECLYCRHMSKGTRGNYLMHLFEKHNLYIAKTENLVFTGELIEFIAKKLEALVCIYCEKVFKERLVLKEHMRKKGHKRINPSNKEYDKFFLVNYLEPGQSWQVPEVKPFKSLRSRSIASQQSAKSRESEAKSTFEDFEDSDPDWSTWEEKNEQKITCLFCSVCEDNYETILTHIKMTHTFDFRLVTKDKDFYQKVKIVNFIRKQIHTNQCIECEEEFASNVILLKHMFDENHFNVENDSLWNQPEYYFPTYEDDPFLCFLEDVDEGFNEKEEKIQEPPEISEQVALAVLRD